jgi:hypothetical protein
MIGALFYFGSSLIPFILGKYTGTSGIVQSVIFLLALFAITWGLLWFKCIKATDDKGKKISVGFKRVILTMTPMIFVILALFAASIAVRFVKAPPVLIAYIVATSALAKIIYGFVFYGSMISLYNKDC